MTGYVLYSLYIAQKAGHQIQAECVKNGLKAVEDYFKKPHLEDWDSIAYLMYINSLWVKVEPRHFQKDHEGEKPGVYQTAHLIRAMVLGRAAAD